MLIKSLNKTTERKEQKRAEKMNGMDCYQEKYRRTSKKIFDICRLKIIRSTQEQQNNVLFEK